jgi:TPP-dependent pyruvate/acetoin dehydrogenase alpha subunit
MNESAMRLHDAALVERLYRSLYRIRRVEEDIARRYPGNDIKSPVHLSIGQEAIAVGVCEALAPDDVVFGTYRGHAMYLAKGGDLDRMIAELFGRVDGCARGKGGSMHLVDVARGVMGTSAVVATTIPNAVGYAYAMKLRREPRIVVSFFGDGATEEGVFYESINFAALKRVPVLFVCENNGWAIHTHQRQRQATLDICGRVRAFGVDAQRIEDGDVFDIHETVAAAAARMRTGDSGPLFIECMTSRWREHVGPGEDFELGFRSREDEARWIENDAVAKLAALIPERQRAAVDAAVQAEIENAFARAAASPFPGADELHRHVFHER